MSEGIRARFVERYGRAQRSPAVCRVLDDAATLEGYLRRSSVFIPTSVALDYIGGELQWARPKSGAEFQILVRSSYKARPRPLKECGSTVITQAKAALAQLFAAVGAAASAGESQQPASPAVPAPPQSPAVGDAAHVESEEP